MIQQEYCKDYYDLKLEVGQKIIPMSNDALIADIKGIVSKTEYSEFYNVWFIDISDDKGNLLLKGVNPRNYSTQERVDEHVNKLAVKYQKKK